ncbi:MAG TPA: DUF1415 family protein [Sandaracinaceae bacterium]
MTRDERLAREAVRVYRRYAIEIVEALGFCPYAQRCREEGRTREIVLTAPIPTDAEVLGAIEAVADDPSVEIGLVLLPRAEVARACFGRWVELLRKTHAAARGGTPVLAIEGFHPHADADTTNADRLTPFVRRSPDPLLQLTRLSVLEHVRRGTPQGTAYFDPSTMSLHALLAEDRRPLHERIAARNLETVLRLGPAEVARRMDAILLDRDASYAAIDPSVPLRLM